MDFFACSGRCDLDTEPYAVRGANAKTAPTRGAPRPLNLWGEVSPRNGGLCVPRSNERSKSAGRDFQASDAAVSTP
jgi:hypothetical protein